MFSTPSLIATLLACSFAATSAHAQVIGDTCEDPFTLSGDGFVSWDMSVMTTPSAQGWTGEQCMWTVSRELDAYICWESNVDGLVEIKTCFYTELDTQLALFSSCECPYEKSTVLCCSDNDCDKQTLIRCNVKCGEQYMLLVNVSALSDLTDIQVEFSAINEPCDDPSPELISCEPCCGEVPECTGFTGLQALASQWREPVSDDPFVLHVFDLDPAGLSAPGTTSAPPTWEHPDWTLEQLGTVFGCAMSGDGTMYAASTAIYNFDYDGMLGSGSGGSIYLLDAVTGAPSELISLPNSGQGLGNIASSCLTNVLYASNFEDGLIWGIDSSGNAVDSFRHSDGSVVGPGGDPNDPSGYVALGDRVWAVQPIGERLYYSVWVEDQGRPDGTRNNEVWSIGIDNVNGAFIANSQQFEFSSPDYVYDGVTQSYTSPIADISQGPDCCLVLGERSMSNDSSSGAHRSRVFTACQNADGSWTTDTSLYVIGDIADSAAGGVAVDFLNDGRVWATGDAISFTGGKMTYGIQGVPRTGGSPANSIKIDLDDNVIDLDDKADIGSIDITCIMEDSGPCMTASQIDTIECVIGAAGPTGEYIVHVEVVNLSDNDAQYLLIPNGIASPSVVVFNPPLIVGASAQFDLIVTGLPNTTVCIPLVLFDAEGDACCESELCVELPECDCTLITDIELSCKAGIAGEFELTFTLTNLTPDVIEHVFLLPPVGSGMTITPDYFNIPPLAQYASTIIGPVTVTTTTPAGDPDSIWVSLHDELLKECCADELPFIVPDCGEGSILGDLNGDGIVDGADLAIMLGSWGSSGPGDLNGDGVVDGADLAILLGAWTP